MNHFDVKRSSRLKTVAENIKLPTPLLSRFDTIFLMLDRPDEERDKILSEHVMSV
jgi:DNA helicase MCM8